MPASESLRTQAQLIDEEVGGLLDRKLYDQACGKIIAAIGPEVRGYLRGIIGNSDDGDDLYQDVCEALHQRLPSFQRRSSVRTYVFAIARHIWYKKLDRVSNRVVKVPIDSAVDRGLAKWQRPPGLHTLLEAAVRERTLDRIYEELTPEERDIYILRTEEKFSFHQIGQIVGCSEIAARQRFHRLTARLRQMAKAYEGEQGDAGV